MDPVALGMSVSSVYQLSGYLSFDILVQYLQEITQQTRAMLASQSYPNVAVKALQENLAHASRQISVMQTRVQVQQDAVMVVNNQMRYFRTQIASRLAEHFKNNHRFVTQ